jgi:prefoldin subunit 5
MNPIELEVKLLRESLQEINENLEAMTTMLRLVREELREISQALREKGGTE